MIADGAWKREKNNDQFGKVAFGFSWQLGGREVKEAEKISPVQAEAVLFFKDCAVYLQTRMWQYKF